MRDAMARGADFCGQSPESDILIHFAASFTNLAFFQSFLKECMIRGFKITDKNKNRLSLLHKAATNPAVAAYLIEQGLETTLLGRFDQAPGDQHVFPLFFAILFGESEEVITLLSTGLSPEEIEGTRTQVAAYRTTIDHRPLSLPGEGFPGSYPR